MKNSLVIVLAVFLAGCGLSPDYRARFQARVDEAPRDVPLTPQLRVAIARAVKGFMDKGSATSLHTARVVNTTITPYATIGYTNNLHPESAVPVYCVTVDYEEFNIFNGHKRYAVIVESISGTQIRLRTVTKAFGAEEIIGPCNGSLKYTPFPELMTMF